MDDTVPFDPNNPEHLEGFERTIKKMAAQMPKDAPEFLVVPKDLYDELTTPEKRGG